MDQPVFHLFGSCVSRDALEFVDAIEIGKYCARQSIVSAVGQRPSQATIDQLVMDEKRKNFHERCVREDFGKLTVPALKALPADDFIIIDYIDERTSLAVTHCGGMITYSQTAELLSNAAAFMARRIMGFSDEYVALFEAAIADFAGHLRDRKVIIHRALYADPEGRYEQQNRILNHYYDLTQSHLPDAGMIDIAPGLRVASPHHRWGAAPYHYIDDYYREFVAALAQATGLPLQAQPGVTKQVQYDAAGKALPFDRPNLD